MKDGDSIRHYLNGEKVVDETIGSDQWNAAVANSKFKDWPDFAGPLAAGEPGRIVLQDHGDEVWFRNVSVRKPGDLGNSTPAGDPAARPDGRCGGGDRGPSRRRRRPRGNHRHRQRRRIAAGSAKPRPRAAG